MTREEVAKVLAVVRVMWPHSNIGSNPDQIIAAWHAMLGPASFEDCEQAVRELAQTGREHAPPVGVIVKALADRATDAPDWDEVRAEVLRAIATYRPPRDVAVYDPYAAPPPEFWSHPMVAGFIDGAWSEWRMAAEGDGTFNAQQREAYKALRLRAERSAGLGLVRAPRGGSPVLPFRRMELGKGGGS